MAHTRKPVWEGKNHRNGSKEVKATHTPLKRRVNGSSAEEIRLLLKVRHIFVCRQKREARKVFCWLFNSPDPAQANLFASPPRMLVMVDDERARQQFQFMAEHLQGQRSRKESGVHKDASAKRKIIRHRPGLSETEMRRWIGKWQFVRENNLNVGDSQSRLIDQQGWAARLPGRASLGSAGGKAGKRNLPRPLAIPEVLNPAIRNDVNDDRRKQRDH
jgi:hypothetical protein